MSTFTTVLLATDLSPQADKLTECLFSLCPSPETEVVLAHVFDDDDDADPDGSSYKRTLSRLEGYKNDIEQAGYEEVEVVTRKGEATTVLSELVEEYDIRLLLVASHRKSFLQRALRGSTTFELAQKTSVPLLINKAGEDEEQGNLLRTVLLPTDFSRQSLEPLNIVRSLREYVGRIIFLYVIERTRSRAEQQEKQAGAERFMQELVDEMRAFGVEAASYVQRGVASKNIVAVCEQEQVSMVLMAKTGADLTYEDELGSTAENVVLNVGCAVLLVPDEDDED
jgi:nucleotide-binding universal stress UspA family protein